MALKQQASSAGVPAGKGSRSRAWGAGDATCADHLGVLPGAAALAEAVVQPAVPDGGLGAAARHVLPAAARVLAGSLPRRPTPQLPAEHGGLLLVQAAQAIHPVRVSDLGEARAGASALHQPDLPESAVCKHSAHSAAADSTGHVVT